MSRKKKKGAAGSAGAPTDSPKASSTSEVATKRGRTRTPAKGTPTAATGSVPDVESTPAPTTASPTESTSATAAAPTTASPTESTSATATAPTSAAESTAAPTTTAESTAAPTTAAESTAAPTTAAESTAAPASAAGSAATGSVPDVESMAAPTTAAESTAAARTAAESTAAATSAAGPQTDSEPATEPTAATGSVPNLDAPKSAAPPVAPATIEPTPIAPPTAAPTTAAPTTAAPTTAAPASPGDSPTAPSREDAAPSGTAPIPIRPATPRRRAPASSDINDLYDPPLRAPSSDKLRAVTEPPIRAVTEPPVSDADSLAYARGADLRTDIPTSRARSSGERRTSDDDARTYQRANTEPPKPPSAAASAAAAALPSPADAAFEAARIVAEMVDIDTVSGAAVAAAAAAGAAVEAAVARSFAAAAADTPPASDGSEGEPVITVRLNRDRVLRALQEDRDAAEGIQAVPASASAAMAAAAVIASANAAALEGDAGGSGDRRATTGAGAAAGSPAAGDEPLDPLELAAQAVARLRRRAQTDLAELRVHYHRHDIVVVIAALVIIIGAGLLHRSMVTPPVKEFEERGLHFEYPASFLGKEAVPLPAPRLARDLTGQTPKTDSVYHVELTSSVAPTARIEVLIDKAPAWKNIVTGLELDRRTRWGELYALDDSSVESISVTSGENETKVLHGGHDWLRTAYRFAHADKGDVPRVDRAVEYATVDNKQIYVITLYGTAAELAKLEEVVASSLWGPTELGSPMIPQTSRHASRTYPDAVARAFDSTVMVVVADTIDGRLRPRGGGSGVIVGADGSILTAYHVLHDSNGRLHDVFVIGRFSTLDHAPQLVCAGRPNRGKLQRELDLALIKCDLDMDGRTWNPAVGGVWPTLPEARTKDVSMGERIWVLGYPDIGGGGLTLSQGTIEGWTAEDRSQGRDFIKTDASITHGNSGGPVIDDHGKLVGIAAAFRIKVTAAGKVVETEQSGLVRPLSTGGDLLAIATAGWTPLEGHTDVDLAPTAVEPNAEGVRLSTKILDVSTEQPIRDALVMVLRKGVSPSAIDVNRLDDQVLSWGRSNTLGEVLLKQPVPPGKYAVMVVARGYEPLIDENELSLTDTTPAYYDPWGKIELQPR